MYCSLDQRDGLLRLDDLDVGHHAGGESVARLRQLLVGQLAARVAVLQLFLRRLQIEERRVDLVVDAGLGILGFGTPHPQLGFGLCDAASHAAAFEQRHVDQPATLKVGSEVDGVRPIAP